MPAIGEKIRLNLQLWDGATDRFVRAYLFDADGAQIAAVNLVHLAFGLYLNDSVLMPPTTQVKAVYKVFSNNLYTAISSKHSDAIDIFELNIGGSSSGGGSCSELVGEISSSEELTGEISECDVINGQPPC